MGKPAARTSSPNSSVDLGSGSGPENSLKDQIESPIDTDITPRPTIPLSRSRVSTKSSSSIATIRSTRADPIKAFFGLSTPYFFLSFTIYAVFAFPEWSIRWWLSGIPLLCFLILLGAHNSLRPNTNPINRLPHIFAILFVHLLLSTSWIAYCILTVLTWPLVGLLAVANFNTLQGVVRAAMRRVGRDLHYFQDKIACFDLPALDIDVHVAGMMVIEGMTFTLSTLTLEAHSIEVALKIDEGLEICFRTEKAVARLGRCIEIGDVYVNLRTEMDTGPGSTFAIRRGSTIDMMTNGQQPEKIHADSLGDAAMEVAGATDFEYPDEDEEYAMQKYRERIKRIHNGTAIHNTRTRLSALAGDRYSRLTVKEKKSMICSALQTAIAITHPPTRSIAVSHLKARTPPWVHEFNNRFPIFQRTLLNVITHLHPVKCNGVIGNLTGLFASGMLERAVFKHYKNENKEISKLASRVQTWLETGNFVVQISKINGVAQVPTTTIYDIIASIKTSTVQVFKVLVAPEMQDSLLDEDDAVSIESSISNLSSKSNKSGASVTIRDKIGIKQEEDKGISEVARINGVSVNVEVPTMLFPHHEYMFPPPPSCSSAKYRGQGLSEVAEDVTVHSEEDDRLEDDVLGDDFDGREPAIRPEDGDKDEVIVLATILASLPAQFNSTILHFATALLKATKLIEIEKIVNGTPEVSSDDNDSDTASPARSRSITRVGSKLSAKMKRTFTGAVDDAWIAKLMGKMVSKVEGLRGEVGYKMPIPVDLVPRRLVGLGPKGTAVDYGLFEQEEIRELWGDNPYRRHC